MRTHKPSFARWGLVAPLALGAVVLAGCRPGGPHPPRTTTTMTPPTVTRTVPTSPPSTRPPVTTRPPMTTMPTTRPPMTTRPATTRPPTTARPTTTTTMMEHGHGEHGDH